MCLMVFAMSLSLFNADFSICTAAAAQQFPRAIFTNNQYYVFWTDSRFLGSDGSYAIFGARVSASGTVLDPDGKMLFKRQSGYAPAVAWDGSNFLVVFRDSMG